jgi:hypothetical protein
MTDGQSASLPWCQACNWGPKTRFLLLSVGGLLMGPLSDKRGSPAQSFSGPSPAGLMTIFYCLRFETSPTWRARSLYLYPPGTRWPGYTPGHWVPFSSRPTTHRATVEVFKPASTWGPFWVHKCLGISVVMWTMVNSSQHCIHLWSWVTCFLTFWQDSMLKILFSITWRTK